VEEVKKGPLLWLEEAKKALSILTAQLWNVSNHCTMLLTMEKGRILGQKSHRYSVKGGWGSRKVCGDMESVRCRRPRPPVMDHSS